MNSQKRLKLLFVVLPLVIPLCGFISITAYKMMNIPTEYKDTQTEYSLFEELDSIDELAANTIKIAYVNTTYTKGSALNARAWIFKLDQASGANEDTFNRPKFIVRYAQKKKELKDDQVSLFGDFNADSNSPSTLIADLEDDPFLEEWREQQKKEIHDETVPLAQTYVAYHKADSSNWDNFATVVSQEGGQSPSPERASPHYIIEGGKKRPAAVLNYLTSENRYLSYANIEGNIQGDNIDWKSVFLEVSFYDQMGDDGLESEFSTSLASQEIQDGTTLFLLRLPSETQGFLMAKVYSKSDRKKEKPLFIASLKNNPLFIPPSGLKGLGLRMQATEEYLDKHQTSFLGKIYDEKGEELKDVDLWVVQTNQQGKSDQLGMFELNGLSLGSSYNLIFDKADYMPVQIPVVQSSKRINQKFTLPLETTFTRGYDLLLGKRDPQKSILFARVLKNGKPVKKVVVKTSSENDIVYERELEMLSVPDKTLFSTQKNGKFISWNAPIGKNKVEIYLSGERVLTKTIKLSPGVVHYLDFFLP